MASEVEVPWGPNAAVVPRTRDGDKRRCVGARYRQTPWSGCTVRLHLQDTVTGSWLCTEQFRTLESTLRIFVTGACFSDLFSKVKWKDGSLLRGENLPAEMGGRQRVLTMSSLSSSARGSQSYPSSYSPSFCSLTTPTHLTNPLMKPSQPNWS